MAKIARWRARWALLISLVLPAAGLAADEQWQIGSTPSFSSGTYGTGTRTEVFYTPFAARRLFADGDITLVVPFMCVWGNGSVTVLSGLPVRQQRLAAIGTTGGRAARRPDAQATVRNCGLGDIVVRGRYYLVDERGWAPTIAVRGHVKAPTASADRGLGTGRPDEGIGVEVSRSIAGGLTAMVDGGYTLIGKPSAAPFNNTWWYDVGLGQDLANGAVTLSALFGEYRAIVAGLEPGRDLLAAVSVKGASGWRIDVAAQFGLSDGAPDRGITVGASRRF
jgi:hypothetical protein